MVDVALPEPANLIPENEAKRIEAVRRYDILDTPPDGAFDRITAIAARLFDVPISVISIVDHDRIWFKSAHGISTTEIGRDPGLCASAILRDEPHILSDAKRDVYALANPLVAGEFGLRFYAGVPLRTHDGFNLGTLCVIDREPREIGQEEIAHLNDLASLVMDQMELRRSAREAFAAKDAMLVNLRDSAGRFHFLAESMPQKIFTAKPNGDVDYFNRQWTEFTGLSFEQIRDWGWLQFIHPDDVEENIVRWKHSIETGEDFELEHRFRRYDGVYRWHLSRGHAMRDAAGNISMWTGSNTEIHEQKELAETLRQRDERQSLLLREMNHRIKNLFTVTGSVVGLSARSAGTPQEMAKAIRGRLEALARAHELVLPTGAVNESTRATTIDALVRAICSPYLDLERADRFLFDGPPLPIGGQAATSVALVLHELATNASKYGALSSPSGRVAVDWSLNDGEFVLTWKERGGPAVEGSPSGQGFGSLLVSRSVEGQLGGTTFYDWKPEGVIVRLSAPAERLAE
ncbi:PAS domain-containing protein [Mesorhizobium sp. AR07]|uniref:sensor histidine kinase n=1 Tax=Mesorhizobium sp. AR07 TaxID=2865838 RepID=UPI00215FEB78|nr:HWE histidine kinase domain-containing protein [Mesorhizobium sp. AR07]UVK46692.1 PAS domain-containing protein [Mesorhizobium sp. AR07]